MRVCVHSHSLSTLDAPLTGCCLQTFSRPVTDTFLYERSLYISKTQSKQIAFFLRKIGVIDSNGFVNYDVRVVRWVGCSGLWPAQDRNPLRLPAHPLARLPAHCQIVRLPALPTRSRMRASWKSCIPCGSKAPRCRPAQCVP